MTTPITPFPFEVHDTWPDVNFYVEGEQRLKDNCVFILYNSILFGEKPCWLLYWRDPKGFSSANQIVCDSNDTLIKYLEFEAKTNPDLLVAYINSFRKVVDMMDSKILMGEVFSWCDVEYKTKMILES